MKTTRQIYSQFLLSTQTNYTCTHLSDHFDGLDENSIYRYLASEKLTPRLVWEKAQLTVEYSPNGYLIFDDMVIDKNFSSKIDGVRKQYSGNAHGLIKGIGVVTCLYYNPEKDKYWLIDFRLFDPERDRKTKLDHVQDMLQVLAGSREELFNQVKTILMDTWYATTEMMMVIDEIYHKIYYCPIKTNRQVDDTGGKEKYKSAAELSWSQEELEKGKLIKIKKFPGNYKHKLFRVVISTDKTELVVTNDLTQNSTDAVQKESAVRWKIEQLHREVKGTTGIEKCQCRKNRSQRNHICCCLLVWHCLTKKARELETTIYQVKQRMLGNYMIEQMKNPSVVFS